ncbi:MULTISPECIES: HD domain-containing protein [unclassified Deinococcus]|uniref:HD-GYP domain-containing protein n=1 Tax=unclassified Deinococcus TaxID=2623546 RepID=UPI0009926F74|nr:MULTISPECIES: HD domain-containing protein [unclassified Deinococcus]MBX8467204.1 HD domain-containing protein [Deinococcus sp. RIT780]NTX99153.1 HD domain-containing protein [Deinococcus sp. JMULE3]OOV12126.1 hypothetical protein BXU09_17575 [Deinococcus sp. LM3]
MHDITLWPSVGGVLEACGREHALDVAHLARWAAPALGIDPEVAYVAGLLHDVGKISVPVDILGAERALSASEWTLVRAHPVEGEGLIRKWWPDAPLAVLHAVRHHHERLDGQGYPDQLRSLPDLTALIAAADVYVALREARPYRVSRSVQESAEILRGEPLPAHVISAVLDAVVPCSASRVV